MSSKGGRQVNWLWDFQKADTGEHGAGDGYWKILKIMVVVVDNGAGETLQEENKEHLRCEWGKKLWED